MNLPGFLYLRVNPLYYLITRTLDTPSIALSSSSASLDAALSRSMMRICIASTTLVGHICNVQAFTSKDLGKLADHIRDVLVSRW